MGIALLVLLEQLQTTAWPVYLKFEESRGQVRKELLKRISSLFRPIQDPEFRPSSG